MRRIRATASITTPTSAVVAAVSVAAVKAYTALASLAVSSRITAVVATGATIATVAVAGIAVSVVEVPRLHAEVYAPAKFIESVGAVDEVAKLIDTVYDSATNGATDAVNYINVIKVLTDSVATTDAIVAFHTKPIDFDNTTAAVEPDPASAIDFPAFDLTRPDITDSVTNSDLAALHPQPVYSDSAGTTDSVDYLNAGKVLGDNAGTTESLVFGGVKRIAEGDALPFVLDLLYLHPQKVLSDGASTSDAISFAPTLVAEDSTLTNDEQQRTITKVLADSVSTQDTVDVQLIPLREFGDSPTTSDVVSISIAAAVDSRAFNGFGFNSTNFN